MSGDSKGVSVKKLSESKKEDIGNYEQTIEDAEKKIAEAQLDIKKIRDKEKIDEMKKKLEKDQADLDKLQEE